MEACLAFDAVGFRVFLKKGVSMIRSLMLAVCCVVSLGTSCSGSRLTCANSLDGSEFGFTLSVPEEFTCSAGSSLSSLLNEVRATYSQAATSIGVTVVVSESQSSGDSNAQSDAAQSEDLGATTNAQDVMFDLQKITIDLAKLFNDPLLGTIVSYAGGTTLPSGKNLIIAVSAESDIASASATEPRRPEVSMAMILAGCIGLPTYARGGAASGCHAYTSRPYRGG